MLSAVIKVTKIEGPLSASNQFTGPHNPPKIIPTPVITGQLMFTGPEEAVLSSKQQEMKVTGHPLTAAQADGLDASSGSGQASDSLK